MNIKSRLTDQETKEIVVVLETFSSAWNKKDVSEFGNCFTENAEFTDVTGQTAIGKQAIMQQHVFPFEVVMKVARLEMDDLYIREIGDNLVIVSAKWRVIGSLTPQGGLLPDRSGILQIILRKLVDRWKIHLVRNSDNALPYERQERFIETNGNM